jgi:hypothetical protein
VTKIGELISWILLSLLLIWVLAMVFAGSPCSRVNRAAWPVVYSVGVAQSLSKHWTDDKTKLDLLIWKARTAVAVQAFFEKTVYGENLKCNK